MANKQIKELDALAVPIEDTASIPIQQGETDPAFRMTPDQFREKILTLEELEIEEDQDLRIALVNPTTGKIVKYTSAIKFYNSGEDDFEGLQIANVLSLSTLGLLYDNEAKIGLTDGTVLLYIYENLFEFYGADVSLTDVLHVDEIVERTANAGVTIEGVTIKDGEILGYTPGGGAGGLKHIRAGNGSYFNPSYPVTVTTQALTNQRVYYYPINIETDEDVDRVGALITATTAPGGSTVAIGLYADNGGTPGAKLIDFGTMDGSVTTSTPITINETIEAGFYWIAVLGVFASGGITVRASGTTEQLVPTDNVADTIGQSSVCLVQNSQSTLPSTATPGGPVATAPQVAFRRG